MLCIYMTVKIMSSLKEVNSKSASLLHAALQNQLQNCSLATKMFECIYSERNVNIGKLSSTFSAILSIRFIPYVHFTIIASLLLRISYQKTRGATEISHAQSIEGVPFENGRFVV